MHEIWNRYNCEQIRYTYLICTEKLECCSREFAWVKPMQIGIKNNQP